MTKASVIVLPVMLGACAMGPIPRPQPASAPVVQQARAAATPDLQGRWTIASVNGRPEQGLWLELGGEGVATITKTGDAVFVGSPQPASQAFLGCNWWHPSGWTREGDRLILGRDMSVRTERGCDEAREALDDQVYAILTKPMLMEFSPPNRLRLANASGRLDLVRTMTERSATAFIEQNIQAGRSLSDAIKILIRGGFACRRLERHEYGPTGPDGLGPKEMTATMCYVATDRTAEGYRLVYANLSANQQGEVVSVGAGSYPVVYRNVRVDEQGRTTVVPDPSQWKPPPTTRCC